MFSSFQIKWLYQLAGLRPPAHLDMPFDKDLRKAQSNPHWTMKEKETRFADVEVECPVCKGEAIDPVTRQPCEWCHGQGRWNEQKEVEI